MENIQNSVSAEFTLKREDGSLVDSSEHSGLINYIEGLNMMVPGIEKALKGRSEGEEFALTLDPADMYGLRDESLTLEVSVKDFHGKADELEEGMIIEADTGEGLKLMTVKSITGEKVVLDSNHPLAGMPLTFSAKVLNCRPATQEEIDKLTKGGCSCGNGDDCCGGSGHDEGDEGCGCGCGDH